MVIKIQNKSEARAEGTRSRGNCKPVFCITTGEMYTSAADAAEKLGVSKSTISWVITGRMKSVRGLRLCAVADITEYLDEISESMKQKYAVYDEVTAWHRANKAVVQHRERCEKLREKLEKEMQLLSAAESEVNKLKTHNTWQN